LKIIKFRDSQPVCKFGFSDITPRTSNGRQPIELK
jgi:hypothetical protein